MPLSRVVESASAKVPDEPGRCSWSLAVPTKNGCTHRRSSSSSPAAMRSCESRPKPYWTMSAPGCSFSSRMVSIGSWSMTTAGDHDGSLSEEATTYFGSAFMRSLRGSPDMADHTGANDS